MAISENEKLSYCVQNDGDCDTCSLVNYGRDCRNRPIKAKRPGKSRKVSFFEMRGNQVRRER